MPSSGTKSISYALVTLENKKVVNISIIKYQILNTIK